MMQIQDGREEISLAQVALPDALAGQPVPMVSDNRKQYYRMADMRVCRKE